MQQIRSANIPLRLKNVKNPGGRGTIIYPCASHPRSGKDLPCEIPVGCGVGRGSPSEGGVASALSANGYYAEGNNERRHHRRSPTAITTKDSIVLLNIQSNRQTRSHGFLAQVFSTLDQMNVVADLVTTSEQSVSIATSLERDDLERLVKLLGRFGNVDFRRGMAVVSVIGHRMQNMVGIAGIFASLLISRFPRPFTS